MTLDEKAFENGVAIYYQLDEGWRILNARKWQTTADGVQFYMAQHRKANDDMDLLIQHHSQIEKQARQLIAEYHTLVNHKYRKLLFFRQPDFISVVISNEPPEQRGKISTIPKVLRFDRMGLGGSFDTAAGTGVQGMAADINKKSTGLPWWGIILAVVGIGLLIIMGAIS